METISLCMIVKNEEQMLRGCLESVRGIVDEIIIVDTGSTDKSVEIAKEFSSKIFSFNWTGNFSEARNESLKHATGQWILYLDADERIAEGSHLRSMITNSKYWGYTLLIRGKYQSHIGVIDQVNAYPRLFRRHPNIKFEGVVHEQIFPSIQKLGKPIGSSSIVIEHLGYGESVDKIREKCWRNISLLKTQLEKNPKDDYARYQLGNTYVVLQEYSNAELELRSVLSSKVDNSIKASTANLLVEVSLYKNNIEEAEFWCLQSLKFVRNQTMARWFLSGILAHADKCGEALQLLYELKNESQSKTHSTGLAHDLVLSREQIEERMFYCFDTLSSNAIKKGDYIEADHWVTESEEFGLRSYVIQRRGLEVSLARKDITRACSRLAYIVNNLPPEAQSQRTQFHAIKAKLEHLTATQFSF